MTTRSCAKCGAKLASGSRSCARCAGAQASAPDAGDLQYGMVDLGGSPDLGGAPALDTFADAAPPRSAGGERKKTPGRGLGTSASAQTGAARRTGSGARAPSATRASVATATASATAAASAATLADPVAQHYGRAMMDEDPFNQAFTSGGGGAALELAAEKAPRERAQPREPSVPPEAAAEESAEQLRARKIAEIAAYGEVPDKVIAAPLYCARVLMRKRALSAELGALSAQRKRADDLANEERRALGEALYALRGDPRLGPLAKLLSAVDSAEHQLGDVQARGERRQKQVEGELARLDQQLERCERAAQPVRARATELAATLDELKTAVKRAEAARKRTENELDAAQKQKGGAPVERVLALQSERDAHHGELQTLGIQMQPIEDELNTVKGELDAREQGLGVLRDKRQAAITIAERTQQNQRVSSGSAQSARVQALSALASAAQKLGLDQLARGRAQAVAESAARADQKRKQEELHRAALHSYDKTMYGRGLTALMSGGVLFFVSLAALILF